MSVTFHTLKVLHPSPRTLIIGDRNDLQSEDVVRISGSFRQIVDKPTRKGRILDIVVTDMWGLFQSPVIIPPIEVVDKAKASGAVPSDHDGIQLLPMHKIEDGRKQAKSVNVRRIPDSSMFSYGRNLMTEDWSFLPPSNELTLLVEQFDEYNQCTLNWFFKHWIRLLWRRLMFR